MIIVASVLAASLSPLLRCIPLRPLPEATPPAGLAIQAAGLAVRIWSMQTLRASYSRTLRTETEQPVVDRGPYRLIRHPGYLGSLMTWTGFALTSRSVSVSITVTGLLARAYSRRNAAEEALLRRELPGYLDYIGRTKKLIPFVR
jgi:protein-S-isoprenylcysteine O-methyltransferase Ste14